MSKIITEEYREGGEDYERTKTVIEKGKTGRGFGLITFSDRYQQVCSLQDSSLATEPAIWLGVSATGPILDGPNGQKNEDVNSRMHLTQAMVKQLLPYLQEFANTGEYVANMKIANAKKSVANKKKSTKKKVN